LWREARGRGRLWVAGADGDADTHR
jgi:hypothetical protein